MQLVSLWGKGESGNLLIEAGSWGEDFGIIAEDVRDAIGCSRVSPIPAEMTTMMVCL